MCLCLDEGCRLCNALTSKILLRLHENVEQINVFEQSYYKQGVQAF